MLHIQMKMNKIAGLCVLIPVLLSGCGNQSSSQPAAASTVTPQASAQATAAAKSNNADRPAMNQAQRGLFSTFQTLVMMDKAEGLAITKEQATAMLPVAQDIVSKSELSDENKTKLLEKLTDAQKKYVEEAATRMTNRGGNGTGGNGNAVDGGGGGRRGERPDGQPAASPGATGSAGDGADTGTGTGAVKPNGAASGGTGDAGANRPAGGPGAGGQMRDPGKQLVELLQERVK